MRYELRCRECHKSWGNVPKSVCEECFSPLEVFYDYDSIRHDFTREKIAQGPNNIWRYSALLPLPEDHTHAARRFHSADQSFRVVARLGKKSIHQE